MRKLLSYLFLLTIVFVNAQNDDCSGAISLNVGANFALGAITSTNVGATTDGAIPSCNSFAVENVWFKVVVPASGKLKIETREALNSPFNNTVLSVYSGTCGSLTQIACDDDSGVSEYSLISLTNQTPGSTLYISVWKKSYISMSNGQFKISAYDPVQPVNDNCSAATSLAVGNNFASGAITVSNLGATTDYSLPSCQTMASDNIWFKAIVPPSGNLTIETQKAPGSELNNTTLSIYSGTCGSLTEIACDNSSGLYFFSKITLTGQTPGTTLYISAWKYSPNGINGPFQISVFEPLLSINDNCSGATPLTVGSNFASSVITSTNVGATTDSSTPSCRPMASNNVWFKAVVPPSGNLAIETRQTPGSLFDSSALNVYSGTCGSLTEIACNKYSGQGGFSLIYLTGQTPGTTLYISVWKVQSSSYDGKFQVAAYEYTPPANDNCSGATPLPVGTNFASGVITSTNSGTTTNNTTPSCWPNASNNVWFKAVVPQSGNLAIETRPASGSEVYDTVLSVYNGVCGSLTELACDDSTGTGYFSLIYLTGQTPGTTLYINVWNYGVDADYGEFRVSAYEFTPPANDNCSGATPLTVAGDFASGAITTSNAGATTDGNGPTCWYNTVDNIWFTVIVPSSGTLTIETKGVTGSLFTNSVIAAYSGTCGSLTQIDCNNDNGQNFFSKISLTGQTPGASLYISVWKSKTDEANGEFQISAYDSSVLSTNEISKDNNKIQVSPNPFTDLVTISDISNVRSISVTDISGKQVRTIKNPSSPVHLGDLSTGIYFINLKMKDGSIKTIKTIKK